MGGTSYSSHIASTNAWTSEQESAFGQRINFGLLKKSHIVPITLTTTPEFAANIGQGSSSIYTFWLNKITFLLNIAQICTVFGKKQ
jgi:hypothetical protein